MLRAPLAIPNHTTNPSADNSRSNDHILNAIGSTVATAAMFTVPHHQPSATAAPTTTHSQFSPLTSSPQLPPSPQSTDYSTRYDRRNRDSLSFTDDIFNEGDLIGEGLLLQGELIRTVPAPPRDLRQEPAKQFQVVRKLGTGSYAVVYLVREIVGRRSLEDLPFELDDDRRDSHARGREFAIKCLSKANLDKEALEAQLFEATVQQSLSIHPNIVTLYRTLETSSFLILVLEYVPGEDLFYFLEQARDHQDGPTHSPGSSSSSLSSATPSSPSILSTLNPSQLLSHRRLRLIASMFSQICDAVASCHDVDVFHRDIKPENFIVTDGYAIGTSGQPERRVIVKLTDFGLATKDIQSADMDCGSAPYMSYECRNNCAPTYAPRAADVWSLGIVLINMLYHHNPWSDTANGACPSFEVFRSQPIAFFKERFLGMTQEVAEFLATRVFCILDDPMDGTAQRISAREFGAWVKDLPAMFSPRARSPHLTSPTPRSRIGSASSRPPALIPPELVHDNGSSINSSSSSVGRPRSSQLRPPSPPCADRSRTSSHRSHLTSQLASHPVTPLKRKDSSDSLYAPFPLSPSDDFAHGPHDIAVAHDGDLSQSGLASPTTTELEMPEDAAISRTTSTTKRRKRGRKGKGLQQASTTSEVDDRLEDLANASQALAREISLASRSAASSCASPVPPSPSPAPSSSLPAKKSKWNMFRMRESSSEHQREDRVTTPPLPTQPKMTVAASTVTNLIMGLNAPTVPAAPAPLVQSRSEPESFASWSKGKRKESNIPPVPPIPRRPITPGSTSGGLLDSPVAAERWNGHPSSDRRSERTQDKFNTIGSSSHGHGGGFHSTNWRNSSSASSIGGSSTFTRFTNGSIRSVSTAATSLSSGSNWRQSSTSTSSKLDLDQMSTKSNAFKEKPKKVKPTPPPLPSNVKRMDGIPWELHELPRQLHVKPHGDIFGSPPTRKPRRAPAPAPLDTISERPRRPIPAAPKSAVYQRPEAGYSGLDINSSPSGSREAQASSPDLTHPSSDIRPKKVQKGQINALGKLLLSLKR